MQALAADAGGFETILTESRNFWQIANLRQALRRLESDENKGETLIMLALTFGRLNATDPRDKLYACLGISLELIEMGKFSIKDSVRTMISLCSKCARKLVSLA